jgi:hsp70-interacting protein
VSVSLRSHSTQSQFNRAHPLCTVPVIRPRPLLTSLQLYVHGALPKILSLIYPAASASGPPHPTSTRGKATYAFSASVKHWPLASSALSANSSQGYSVLRRGVSDPQPVIRRKMAFLVGTLVMQSNETYTGELPDDVRQLIEERTQTQHDTQTLIAGLEKEGVFNALVEALRTSDGDIEFEENAIRTLSQAAKQGALSDEEKKASKGIWATWGAEGQSERGLGGEDGKVVEQSLA